MMFDTKRGKFRLNFSDRCFSGHVGFKSSRSTVHASCFIIQILKRQALRVEFNKINLYCFSRYMPKWHWIIFFLTASKQQWRIYDQWDTSACLEFHAGPIIFPTSMAVSTGRTMVCGSLLTIHILHSTHHSWVLGSPQPECWQKYVASPEYPCGSHRDPVSLSPPQRTLATFWNS